MTRFFLGLFLGSFLAVSSPMAREDAKVYILSPKDGEHVGPSLPVVFGLRGFGIAPAGVERDGTGHHHLLIDAPLPDPDSPIPADDRHLHFGAGQTETVIELEPGPHTLRLVLGDAGHVPIPSMVSDPIRITVLADPSP